MSTGFEEFAKAHGLEWDPNATLPQEGALLSRDDLKIEAAATGELPGGESGTACQLTYTYRSDDTTHTERRTAAIVRVPESIGFAPYLAEAGAALRGIPDIKCRTPKLESDLNLRVAEGVDDGWLKSSSPPR